MAEKNDEVRQKHRDEKLVRGLTNRLSRIEGQVRGIKGMLENDAYCVDILTQVMAVQSALNAFNKVLLSEHMRSCVVEDVKNGDGHKVEEALEVIQKLMK